MGTINKTPLAFPLENTDCSDDANSESSSSDVFIPKGQENEDFDEPKPSCSGLNLRPKSKSMAKSQEPNKPSFPWKYIWPKRGVSKLIFQVVSSTEKRSGISLQALKKSVAATGYDLEKRKTYFKRVLRALVAKGLLKKLTGHGLTGSYAISAMMMKAMKRRKNKRWRRKRKRQRKSMAAFMKKKTSKRRKQRKSKSGKSKLRQSDPSELSSPMLMEGSFHS
ncbi:spermatid-specific linker histone H1-like protein [Sceloporus undulatus]|uniref:spermatid-specific linker histone H1-like protein n=1 Tax=Sceloporus undulatus TaxID=8520 RepID=UPI001C4B4468|nr:spermatid-specific linker histone H1-like protein [Sceloporus undulatus]